MAPKSPKKKKIVHRQVRLSTKDSNIEVGTSQAFMERGVIGIQVIIYKGRILTQKGKIDIPEKRDFSRRRNRRFQSENE